MFVRTCRHFAHMMQSQKSDTVISAGDTDSKPDLLLTICMKNHQTNDLSVELLTNNKCFSVEYLTEQHILQSQWLSMLTVTTQTNSTDTRCLL